MDLIWTLIPISLIPAVAAFIAVLGSYSYGRISKRGAILAGMSLIAGSIISLFGLASVTQPFAEFLARPEMESTTRLSQDQLKHATTAINIALWILPFISASLGTNLISDALTGSVRYTKRSKPRDRSLYWHARAIIEAQKREKAAGQRAHLRDRFSPRERLDPAARAKCAKQRRLKYRERSRRPA